MKAFKFRVVIDVDTDETIFRDILIGENQTFEAVGERQRGRHGADEDANVRDGNAADGNRGCHVQSTNGVRKDSEARGAAQLHDAAA